MPGYLFGFRLPERNGHKRFLQAVGCPVWHPGFQRAGMVFLSYGSPEGEWTLMRTRIQFAATKGYNILPVGRIQRYMKGIDVKSALQKNVPFKISLGTTLILAAFAEF